MRAADPGRGEFRAEGDHQQRAQTRQPIDEPAEHVERSRVDPMRVLQQREDGGVFGQPLEQRDQRRDRPLLLFARGHFKRGVSPLDGDRQQAARKGAMSFAFHPERAIIASSLSSRAAAGSPLTKPAACQIWLDDRIEGVVDVVRRALIAHPHMRLAADPLAERRQNARLADARLAREQHDLAFALARVAPAVQEQRHLMLAPDEGRHALRPRRLEPADVLGLAQNRPGGNRRVEAFERLRRQAASARTPRPAAAASTPR